MSAACIERKNWSQKEIAIQSVPFWPLDAFVMIAYRSLNISVSMLFCMREIEIVHVHVVA